MLTVLTNSVPAGRLPKGSQGLPSVCPCSRDWIGGSYLECALLQTNTGGVGGVSMVVQVAANKQVPLVCRFEWCVIVVQG